MRIIDEWVFARNNLCYQILWSRELNNRKSHQVIALSDASILTQHSEYEMGWSQEIETEGPKSLSKIQTFLPNWSPRALKMLPNLWFSRIRLSRVHHVVLCSPRTDTHGASRRSPQKSGQMHPIFGWDSPENEWLRRSRAVQKRKSLKIIARDTKEHYWRDWVSFVQSQNLLSGHLHAPGGTVGLSRNRKGSVGWPRSELLMSRCLRYEHPPKVVRMSLQYLAAIIDDKDIA